MKIFAAFINTLHEIATTRSLIMTIVISVIFYSFFYPAPYTHQVTEQMPIVVIDNDDSILSRQLLRAISNSRQINIVEQSENFQDGINAIKMRKAEGILLIPKNLEDSILFQRSSTGISIWLNGSYLLRTKAIGTGIEEAIKSEVEDFVKSKGISESIIKSFTPIVTRPLYNNLEGYASYVFPMVANIILQQTLLFGAAMFASSSRRKQVASSEKWHFSGFVGSYLAFAFLGILGTIFIFGTIFKVQDINTNPNITLLMLTIPMFSSSIVGLGLFLGRFFKSPEYAFATLAPTSVALFFLSGAAWPLQSMPNWLAAFSNLSPATIAVHIFTPLNIMGAGFEDVKTRFFQMLIMAILYSIMACCVNVTYLRNKLHLDKSTYV
jgi:ABC-2 type transport system permease protein